MSGSRVIFSSDTSLQGREKTKGGSPNQTNKHLHYHHRARHFYTGLITTALFTCFQLNAFKIAPGLDPEGFGHFASYIRSEMSKIFWVTQYEGVHKPCTVHTIKFVWLGGLPIVGFTWHGLTSAGGLVGKRLWPVQNCLKVKKSNTSENYIQHFHLGFRHPFGLTCLRAGFDHFIAFGFQVALSFFFSNKRGTHKYKKASQFTKWKTAEGQDEDGAVFRVESFVRNSCSTNR